VTVRARLGGALPRLVACVLLVAASLLGTGCGDGGDETPTIAAAASLRRVMPALIDAYGTQTFHVSYAGSGTLRQQIEAGAPYDLALFAGPAHADRLLKSGLAVAGSRTLVASNTLVLIGPTDAKAWTFASLKDLPADAHLAVGSPESVPAGTYAREALRNLGIWEAVEPRCVFAEHVGAVLTLVRRGEVAAGIVYGSEVVQIDDIQILESAEGDWVPTPSVVAVRLRDAPHSAAGAGFLAFLSTPRAQAIFARFGFGAP
jgi:molybdate transport system substrate-binding protein